MMTFKKTILLSATALTLCVLAGASVASTHSFPPTMKAPMLAGTYALANTYGLAFLALA